MLITLVFEHDLPDAQSLHRPRAPVDRPDCHGWPFWRSSSSSSAMPTTILLHRSGRVSARDLISPVHRAAGVWTGSCRPGGYSFSVRAGLGARWRQPFLDAGTVNPAAWPILIISFLLVAGIGAFLFWRFMSRLGDEDALQRREPAA
jgi:hypothetical protein